MRRMWLEAWTAPSEPDEDTAPPKGAFSRGAFPDTWRSRLIVGCMTVPHVSC